MRAICFLFAFLALAGCSQEPTVLLPDSESQPEWVSKLIQELESEPLANPPAFLARYLYHGQVVYFLPQRCCDIPSVLWDAEGTVLCSPDGGITGEGDGKCPDFHKEKSDEVIIWRDPRN